MKMQIGFVRQVLVGLSLLSLMSAWAACSGQVSETTLGGESHFLRTCSSTCGDGLTCISQVCTRSCLVNKDSCDDLTSGAVCTNQSIESGNVAVCDRGCSLNSDCKALGSGYRCEGGYCRGKALDRSSGQAGASSGVGGSSTKLVTATTGSAGIGGSLAQMTSGAQTGGTTGTTPITNPPLVDVVRCADDAKTVDVTVAKSYIAGDRLLMTVGYEGCENVPFTLCYGPTFLESYPVQTSLKLQTADSLGTCGASVVKNLAFNLGPLAEAYVAAYSTEAGGQILTEYGTYVVGQATCDQWREGAMNQRTRLAKQVNLSCVTADDCKATGGNSICAPDCGVPVSKLVSEDWTKLTEEDLLSGYTAIEAAQCATMIAQNCPLYAIDCAPVPLACEDKRCVVAANPF